MKHSSRLLWAIFFMALLSCNQPSEESYLNEALKTRSTRDVLQVYSECVENIPEAVECRLKRGAIYVKLKDYKKAKKDFWAITQINSEHKVALMNLGLCDLNLKNYLEAIKTFDQLILLDSLNALAYYNRGLSKGAFGAYDAAIIDYTEAVRLDTTNLDAFTNRGLAYRQIGQFDLAVTDLLYVVKKNKTLASAHYNLGLALFDSGQFSKGCIVFQRAKSLGDKEAELIINRFCK